MILFILSGAFVLGMSIFIHELGHFCFGYMVGVKAEIFSIGYGKGRFKKKIGDTTWQITAIPLGGYVKFYGDENPDVKVTGGFYSVSPLRRIIPVLGGPLFNLILAFIIYLVLHSLSGPLAPRIDLPQNISKKGVEESPAIRAGFKDGDIVTSIDGKGVHSFMDMVQIITLSEGRPLKVKLDRKGEILEKELSPTLSSNGMAFAGLHMPGERYLQVSYGWINLLSYHYNKFLGVGGVSKNLRAYPYLKNGDILLRVEGQRIEAIEELQNILAQTVEKKSKSFVKVEVLREKLPWLAPWPKEKKEVEVPVHKEISLHLTHIIDKKYNYALGDQVFYSMLGEHQLGLNYIKINNKAPGSFQELLRNFSKSKKVNLSMGANEFEAEVQARPVGLLGFRPSTTVYGEYLPRPTSYKEIIESSARDLKNNIMIYPSFMKGIFSGRYSFIENAAGPVRIFGTAGVILESGYQNYLQFFASISIALFIINLMPFPIVDGGHIVFFLYEAISRKPVSARFRDVLNRLGFSTLMFLGLWIMYKDVLWLFSN